MFSCASLPCQEVSAIALQQLIRPELRVVLMRFEGSGGKDLAWNTNFDGDQQRQAYHDKKMASKDERPGIQIGRLGIPPGKVHHILVQQS